MFDLPELRGCSPEDKHTPPVINGYIPLLYKSSLGYVLVYVMKIRKYVWLFWHDTMMAEHMQRTCMWFLAATMSLQWCHYERDGVSSHRRHDCLHNRPVTRKRFPFDDVIMLYSESINLGMMWLVMPKNSFEAGITWSSYLWINKVLEDIRHFLNYRCIK